MRRHLRACTRSAAFPSLYKRLPHLFQRLLEVVRILPRCQNRQKEASHKHHLKNSDIMNIPSGTRATSTKQDFLWLEEADCDAADHGQSKGDRNLLKE
jgi:hypothetical protein